jgi:non-ribosomal peptide synthetase component E (peptide arylation enzyme)
MAKAATEMKTVVEETVTLTLSKEEAEVVMTLAGSVTGSSETSPRKHADSVYYALSAEGLTARYRRHLDGMRFLDQPKVRTW